MKKLGKKLLVTMLALAMVFALSATAFAEGEAATAVPADGTYKITVETGEKMFKVVDASLKVENGKMTAVLTLSGTGYGYLYAGAVNADDTDPLEAVAEADRIPYVENEAGKYTYEVPVDALDKPLDFGSFSNKNHVWYDRHLTFDSSTLIPAEDGYYSITVETGEKMFKVVDALLKVENGKMTAVLTLSGTGYGYLYAGAVNADDTDTLETVAEADRIPYVENEAGKYTYEVPVASLNTALDFGSFSNKNHVWYDRHLTFKADTLAFVKNLGDEPATQEPAPAPSTGGNDNQNGTQPTETAAKDVPKTSDSSALPVMIALLILSGGAAVSLKKGQLS